MEKRSDNSNNNKKKASASSSSLPKSSVSYPKAKKDGARLIAQSCNGGNNNNNNNFSEDEEQPKSVSRHGLTGFVGYCVSDKTQRERRLRHRFRRGERLLSTRFETREIKRVNQIGRAHG